MSFAVRQFENTVISGGAPPPPPPPSLLPFQPTSQGFGVGAFNVTVPGASGGYNGPSSMFVEIGGPGGGGAYSPYLTRSPPGCSGSGGSGAYCSSTIALTSANWGQTITITVQPGPAGGDPTYSFNGRPHSGLSFAPSPLNSTVTGMGLNMVAQGGWGGSFTPNVSGATPGNPTGGAGGNSSGGNTSNQSGHVGGGDTALPNLSHGGAGISGRFISSGAGGDASHVSGGDGSPGGNGAAAVAFS